MKILESKFYDLINLFISKIQERTDILRKNSFILSSLDILIFLFIILTICSSLFVQTEIMGIISFAIPMILL